jgi:Leucine-rich repeat (LRR) protein
VRASGSGVGVCCCPALLGLTSVVHAVPRLEFLKLTDNPLATLPDALHSLEQLKKLDVSFTNLRSFHFTSPSSRLTSLNLSHCAFAGVLGHPVLALPRSLVELDLSFNVNVTAFGASFGFEALPLLEDLNLSSTGIVGLPETLSELKRLSCLKLENTRVSEIPPGLFLNTPVARLELKGTLITKERLLQMPGCDQFMERRLERLNRDVAAGVHVNTSLCGLD